MQGTQRYRYYLICRAYRNLGQNTCFVHLTFLDIRYPLQSLPKHLYHGRFQRGVDNGGHGVAIVAIDPLHKRKDIAAIFMMKIHQCVVLLDG